MPEPQLDSALLVQPPDKPAYRPFPELAQAIRSQTDRILDEWRGRTLFSMPELSELTVAEFKNSIAKILTAMADALESNDPPELNRLMRAAPAHGFHRFMQDYDLSELFAEERVLRRVIVARVEEALGRPYRSDEAASLHAMIDISLQQGVLALVQQQRQELQHASEIQLKYLSFLSHDLSNNFLVITTNLGFIQQQLKDIPQTAESAEVIGASLEIIRRTRDGMRRLLEHERLRNSDVKPRVGSIKLLDILDPIVKLATSDVRGSGVRIVVDIDAAAVVNTNAELLTIILQNLIGNAIKHISKEACKGESACVRIEAQVHHKGTQSFWVVAVADDGPGIPEDQLARLFKAFEQLAEPGENRDEEGAGFGLGLAIASQAARLLGTTIEVTTQVGRGSRFSITLPVA